MKIAEINRSRIASVMVRDYFHAFLLGLADVLYPGKKRLELKEYKQLLVSNFGNLLGHFVSVLSPVLIRLNYSDFDIMVGDMKRCYFSETTSAKILLCYTCGNKELYDLVTAEYQKQMFALLDGHLQPTEDYFADCSTLARENNVPVSLIIHSIVRVQMQAYVVGVTQAKTEINGLHQATVYRLMIAGMMTLLYEEPVKFEEENLEMMLRKVSLDSDNFKHLMNETNQACRDLV